MHKEGVYPPTLTHPLLLALTMTSVTDFDLGPAHPAAHISLASLAVTSHPSAPSTPLLVRVERRHVSWQTPMETYHEFKSVFVVAVVLPTICSEAVFVIGHEPKLLPLSIH
jgi:hypothetical protein